MTQCPNAYGRHGARDFAVSALSEQADAVKAQGMKTYMNTDMPFYGLQKPRRNPISKELVSRHRPATRDEYEDLVLALWGLPPRDLVGS